MDELKHMLYEHHRKAGFICCPETCFCWDVESLLSLIKVFTDRGEAEKFCAEKNKTASRAKEYEEYYTVQEVEK